jgi:hypothetical protein
LTRPGAVAHSMAATGAVPQRQSTRIY